MFVDAAIGIIIDPVARRIGARILPAERAMRRGNAEPHSEMTHSPRGTVRARHTARGRHRFALFTIALIATIPADDGEGRRDSRCDDVVARSALDHPRVVAALDEVISSLAAERALPCAPIDHIAAVSAPDRVFVPTPIEPIVAGSSKKFIVAGISLEMIVVVSAREIVPFIAANQVIISRSAVELVVPITPFEHVVARATYQEVFAPRALR